LDSHTEAAHFLVDAKGRDVVDGKDRSGLLALRAPRSRPRGRYAWPAFLRSAWSPARDGPTVLAPRSSDRKYRLITVVPSRPHLAMSDLLVYFLWLPLLIGVLCYLLAVHLASPLRGLRRALEKFGRGELGV